MIYFLVAMCGRTRTGSCSRKFVRVSDHSLLMYIVFHSVNTLLLREHNRLCDIVVAQHPDWDDERIYQTIKLVIGAKIALIGNSYQMAYW
jgi:Animal haem peroxidase